MGFIKKALWREILIKNNILEGEMYGFQSKAMLEKLTLMQFMYIEGFESSIPRGIAENRLYAFLDILDTQQQLAKILHDNSDYPFLKKNLLLRGFVTRTELKNILNPYNVLGLNIYKNILINFGRVYSLSFFKRFINIAQVWSYI